MSTHTTVEVFLGNPIDIASEKQFVARLRRDLLTRGVSCRILGNLQLGKDARQVDFVIVTEHRTVLVELKTFPGPIVAAPLNGDWQVRVGAADVREIGNPARQAQDATYAFSDEMHAFAADEAAPNATRGKFFRDVDTVVCAFPALPQGSCAAESPYVTLLGYADLLERLQQPGRRVAWADADWDAFGRRLNLYRDDEDSQEGIVRRAGAAAVDAYRGLYLTAHLDLPPLVKTAVNVGGAAAARPDLPALLTEGRAVLLHGPSEFGKTLWARTAGAELARAGEIPVWLAAEVCEESFRTSMARAIAPYTSLSPDELLRAAEAAGRAVVFIVDDLGKATDAVRQALLDGTEAVRLRHRTCGLLVTAQAADAVTSLPDTLDVELLAPTGAERQALLVAYGAPQMIDRCDAFVSPLELSLAAAYAGTLPPGASAAELIDLHIDRRVSGDDRLRGGLRATATLMHRGVTPSLRRPDLARTLRRDHGMTDPELQALWSCPILTAAHGRVSFRHERFEHFLMAEAVLIGTPDASTLARTLNTSRYAAVRADAVALEGDERRLGELLSGCEHADLLVAAATGRLGTRAARVTETILTDALNVACAQTTADDVTFDAGDGMAWDGRWAVAGGGPTAHAQLEAVGRLLPRGRFVDGCARLLDHTDALCARALQDAQPAPSVLADQMFAATYALGGHEALPATIVVLAATHTAMFDRGRHPETVAVAWEFLRADEVGLGRLWVAAEFLRRADGSAKVADVIVRCLKARRYHLLLHGLQLAEYSGRLLDPPARQRVVDAVHAVPTDNLMISTSVVETLSALGELTPAKDVDDITTEIRTVLGMQDDPLGRQMAYGIVSSQFETEAIGPYYEAVQALPDPDRQRLLAMALDGSDTDSFSMGWILGEITDAGDPFTRAAVERYVARTDPSTWFSPQSGMDGAVGALRLLAAANLPLPAPTADGPTDPGWRASLAVVMAALAGEQARLDAAWAALLDQHADVVASLLVNLRQMHGLHMTHSDQGDDVHGRVLATMPNAGIDALLWSLEHPDRIRSLCRFDRDVRGYLVDVLGQIGDHRAADVLRRFVEDSAVGESAAAAVRAIEARAIA
jgi:hypothetical protein